ncbi:MAG: hypothetical protein ACK5LO_17475, partial [Leucobacter sp.]
MLKQHRRRPATTAELLVAEKQDRPSNLYRPPSCEDVLAAVSTLQCLIRHQASALNKKSKRLQIDETFLWVRIPVLVIVISDLQETPDGNRPPESLSRGKNTSRLRNNLIQYHQR